MIAKIYRCNSDLDKTSFLLTITTRCLPPFEIRIMFSSLRYHLGLAFLPLLVCLLSVRRIESFQLGQRGATDIPAYRSSSNGDGNFFDSSQNLKLLSKKSHFYSPVVSSTEISLKKKTGGDEEPEREKKNAIELVILYMTPWRNPNSIFVYLFATVYFLGKYSEAQSIAASAGTM